MKKSGPHTEGSNKYVEQVQIDSLSGKFLAQVFGVGLINDSL